MIADKFIPNSVDSETRGKYARVMSNWSYLSAYLASNDPDAETIGKLIRIELDGKHRQDIVDRLRGRLSTAIGNILRAEVGELYEGTRRT